MTGRFASTGSNVKDNVTSNKSKLSPDRRRGKSIKRSMPVKKTKQKLGWKVMLTTFVNTIIDPFYAGDAGASEGDATRSVIT